MTASLTNKYENKFGSECITETITEHCTNVYRSNETKPAQN